MPRPKGFRLTQETKDRIRQSLIRDDDNITVHQLHWRMKKVIPKPKLCQICNKVEPVDLSNISSKYNPQTYNHDVNNWRWICRRCHMKSDGRLENLISTFNGVKDMSDRKCSVCEGQTDIDRTTGRPHWRTIENKLFCRRCYRRVIDGSKVIRGPYRKKYYTKQF